MFHLILGPTFSLLLIAISLLPEISFNVIRLDSIVHLMSMLYESSFFIPYFDVFNCINLITFYYVSLTGFKGFNWVIHRIPLVG